MSLTHLRTSHSRQNGRPKRYHGAGAESGMLPTVWNPFPNIFFMSLMSQHHHPGKVASKGSVIRLSFMPPS